MSFPVVMVDNAFANSSGVGFFLKDIRLKYFSTSSGLERCFKRDFVGISEFFKEGNPENAGGNIYLLDDVGSTTT